MECEVKATSLGYTEEEIEEMPEYGIQPYDEDSWVSAALSDLNVALV